MSYGSIAMIFFDATIPFGAAWTKENERNIRIYSFRVSFKLKSLSLPLKNQHTVVVVFQYLGNHVHSVSVLFLIGKRTSICRLH